MSRSKSRSRSRSRGRGRGRGRGRNRYQPKPNRTCKPTKRDETKIAQAIIKRIIGDLRIPKEILTKVLKKLNGDTKRYRERVAIMVTNSKSFKDLERKYQRIAAQLGDELDHHHDMYHCSIENVVVLCMILIFGIAMLTHIGYREMELRGECPAVYQTASQHTNILFDMPWGDGPPSLLELAARGDHISGWESAARTVFGILREANR